MNIIKHLFLAIFFLFLQFSFANNTITCNDPNFKLGEVVAIYCDESNMTCSKVTYLGNEKCSIKEGIPLEDLEQVIDEDGTDTIDDNTQEKEENSTFLDVLKDIIITVGNSYVSNKKS